MEVDESLNFSFPAEPDVGDLGDTEDTLSINFNWTVDQELLLFEAMMGHKPVGVDKNIHMMCIHRKMNSKWRLISKSSFITPKHIWTKLRSMYDLEALDESECIPFPEKTEDFVLPKEDFEKFMSDFPTNSNNTSRSSTVDREVEEETKNAEATAKDDLPAEEAPAPDPATATAAEVTSAATPTATTTAIAAATTSTTLVTSSATATLVTSATISSTATTTATPSSGPSATSTPTSTKTGRKRSKATTNQSESDKTPSGPSSAKRSRR